MMDDAAQAVLFGQIRTALAAIGGALVTQGIASSATVNIVVGVIMAVVPFAWSAWAHLQADKKAKAQAVIALNVGIKIADATAGPTPIVLPADAPQIIKTIAPTLPAALAEPPTPEVQPTKGPAP